MARLQELLIGLGAAQADISTVSASFQRFAFPSARPFVPAYRVEDNATDIGKGHEFATALYKSHMEGAFTLEKYLSVEFLNWLLPKALGHTASTTYTPADPVTDGEELPYFSYLEQMRPGGSAVIDTVYIGCAVKSFRIRITSGPGRANAMVTVECVHSGKVTTPSTESMPAATVETLLNAYSLACTINGVDYVTAKDFVSLEMGWDNAFVPGFYPGSGQQDSYQIQGRFEIGNRLPSFQFVARYKNGSAELTKLRDLTTGTAVIGLTSGSKGATFTWEAMGFEVAELGETDGKLTVQVTGKPLYHSVNGVLTAELDLT